MTLLLPFHEASEKKLSRARFYIDDDASFARYSHKCNGTASTVFASSLSLSFSLAISYDFHMLCVNTAEWTIGGKERESERKQKQKSYFSHETISWQI
jgi:hypothetical protein